MTCEIIMSDFGKETEFLKNDANHKNSNHQKNTVLK